MNPKIKAIQEILFPHDPSEWDGVWGPQTDAALAVLKEADSQPIPTTAVEYTDDGERHINQRGIDLVKSFEGWYPHAYKDEVGVWTIGWGHTGLTHQDGTVYAGREITRDEGEALLRHDMRAFEDRVKRFVTVPLTDDQFAALVSFDFNTGGLGNSTLLRVLNMGDYAGAADQFLRWTKAGGVELAGLVRRRKSERNLFLGKADYIVE